MTTTKRLIKVAEGRVAAWLYDDGSIKLLDRREELAIPYVIFKKDGKWCYDAGLVAYFDFEQKPEYKEDIRPRGPAYQDYFRVADHLSRIVASAATPFLATIRDYNDAHGWL